jgi:hypothetical protein
LKKRSGYTGGESMFYYQSSENEESEGLLSKEGSEKGGAARRLETFNNT